MDGETQEPSPENPMMDVGMINTTEKEACVDQSVNEHPKLLMGRNKMSPSDRDETNEEKREASINQACNDVINDLMDRFIKGNCR
ncbi:hypothetical protein SUGI_0846120 [Cryptomeria japonica]|nr:hypothetical protein SUGI_0846120 [Cryptomeria japonica]